MRTEEGTAQAATHHDTVLDEEPATTSERIAFTRGISARTAMSWVRQLHGLEGERLIREALDEHTVALLGGPTLEPAKLGWVSFVAYARLLETIDGVLGNGDLSVLRAVGRYAAFRDLPVVAKPIARMMNPGAFVDFGAKLWRFYHSHGTFYVERRASSCSATLSARPAARVAFCATLQGFVEGALLFCGAHDVHIHEVRCQARGAKSCAYEMTWR